MASLRGQVTVKSSKGSSAASWHFLLKIDATLKCGCTQRRRPFYLPCCKSSVTSWRTDLVATSAAEAL